jgi:hypothetical protein
MIWLIPLFFIVPLIFQFMVGNNGYLGSIRLKFWKTCLISIFGQFILIVVSIGIFDLDIVKRYYGDETSGLWIGIISMVFIILLYLIMGIQLYANIQDNNSNR